MQCHIEKRLQLRDLESPACVACKWKDRMAWWIVAAQIIETVDMPKSEKIMKVSDTCVRICLVVQII